MVFSDSTYSVLLVSASDAFNRSVLSLLPPSRFYPVAQVPDLRAARECAPADLVIVNAPLPGGDSLSSNIQLVLNNARLAAQIAQFL